MKSRAIALIAASVTGLALVSPDTQAALIFSDASTITLDFEDYRGEGFSPTPSSGQLDSNTFIMNLVDDNSMTFGDTRTAGAWAFGTSSTGGGDGDGLYAYDTDENASTTDYSFGIRPRASASTYIGDSGFEIRLQNLSGMTIEDLAISYEIKVRNDDNDSHSVNFSYSYDGSTYTNVSSLDFSTPGSSDSTPSWTSTDRATVLEDVNVADGGLFYVRFSGTGGSSGNRDAFALDDITFGPTLVPEPGSLALVACGTALILARRRR